MNLLNKIERSTLNDLGAGDTLNLHGQRCLKKAIATIDLLMTKFEKIGPKIYLVYGSTGEYSGHTLWNIQACSSKEQAQELVEKLNNWCKENGVYQDKVDSSRYDRWNLKCPYDKYFRCDYTGTSYGLEEVDLV
jgi:hypothetical protein